MYLYVAASAVTDRHTNKTLVRAPRVKKCYYANDASITNLLRKLVSIGAVQFEFLPANTSQVVCLGVKVQSAGKSQCCHNLCTCSGVNNRDDHYQMA